MKPAYLDFFKLLHASLLVFINDQVVYRADGSSADRSEYVCVGKSRPNADIWQTLGSIFGSGLGREGRP